MKLTNWIPTESFPRIRISLEVYEVPRDIAVAILADRDGNGGLYASTVVDRARIRGYGNQVEQALGIER